MFQRKNKPEENPPAQLKTHKRKQDSSQPSIYAYLKQNNSQKRLKVTHTIQSEQKNQAKAPTIVSYRDDGWGKGAYYDHYTLQLLTNKPTSIAVDAGKQTDKFINYLQNATLELRFGEVKADKRHAPPIVENINEGSGLLFIPGIARNTLENRTKEYEERKAHEYRLIRQAVNTGQPILTICGGSWTLWEFFGGKLKEAAEHSYRGGMPRIKDTTGKIGYNIQIHRIFINDHALVLKAAMAVGSLGHAVGQNFSVNSVHWLAADDIKVPDVFAVSAHAIQDNKLAPLNSKRVPMAPEENTIEAFEAKHGAPVLGIQWHPEAYTNNTPAEHFPNNHQHIIRYMAQAGQTFKNRQNLVADFKQKIAATKKISLKPIGLFSNHTEVRKFTYKKQGTFSFRRATLFQSKHPRHLSEVDAEIRMKEEYVKEKIVNAKKNSVR